MTLKSQKHSARQQREASAAIARLHGLDTSRTMLLQQSPQAIDKGVFHNDVIAMNTTRFMAVHAQAFIPEHQAQLRAFFASDSQKHFFEIQPEELTLEESVSTYLFNSQLLELPDKKIALVCPSECGNHAGVTAVIHRLKSEGVLDQVHYLDVHESMRNGGGPACLRLRIVLTPEQEQSMSQTIILTDEKYLQLRAWVQNHYRDRLQFSDLRDPALVMQLDDAYVAIANLIGMPKIYDPWRGY